MLISPIKVKKISLSFQNPPVEEVSNLFPFHVFFNNAPKPLFHGKSYEKDWDIAEGCFRYIKQIFTQLDVSAKHDFMIFE